MIAFTSEFIPRLVYSLRHSKDLSLSGFVNFTLSKFDVDDYDEDARPDNTTLEGTMVRECRWVASPYRKYIHSCLCRKYGVL
ncbi:hypothetical protein HPB48_021797 [Haemaphysalis longicornis]|uniref:Uncharacterized protein n=1 Tax=Haemaphysalis longicornis TaxID=44386 RepID=A0A9J6GAP7_HAELO|nr:hypothetical protein HPB48_021797 [Haemaphysalis longicornis]